MKIAFVTPSVSRAAGGIFEIERRLGQSLAAIKDTSVSVYGLKDDHTESDLASWSPLEPNVFPTKGPSGFGYAPNLTESMLSDSFDLGHLHALWMFTSIAMGQWATKAGRPYVVTPNGMLEPWALRNSAWKKRLASLFYERRMLNGAACLQANTEKEAADIRAFGLKNPIAIIPNGIDLPVEDHGTTGPRDNGTKVGSQWSVVSSLKTEGRKILLYLGRLHPKKGLINLLKAWASCHSSPVTRHSDWTLALAGWDQGGHESELKQLATELGIAWSDVQNTEALKRRNTVEPDASSKLAARCSLLFLGPLFGAEKAAAYANCDAFILPSFSEGLPMAVLEAWAYNKPVLMTPECNLPEGFAANAALRVAPSAESIAQGVRLLLAARDSELAALGANGRRLAAEKFTWPKIATQMRSVYEWAIGGGAKPDCVVG